MSYKNKIEIYLDGPTIKEIHEADEAIIDGYTFNPSLFRKNKAVDYIDHSKELLSITDNKPVSLEVIADNNEEMISQGKKLNSLGKNIYVKIPITNTKGISTLDVMKSLKKENIKMNITAVFELEQVEEIISVLSETESIISVFSGRLFDIGLNAVTITKSISKLVHGNSSCKVLWASTRMLYDIHNAINAECDIITIGTPFIKKLNLFDKSPGEYSLETVKMFYEDAVNAKYSI